MSLNKKLGINIVLVWAFSTSLYCQTNNNFYKVKYKSFFNRNDLITNNNVENLFNKDKSTNTRLIFVNDSIAIKEAFNFEEVSDKFIHFTNSFMDINTGRYVDFGLNYRLHDSLIFTGTQFINLSKETRTNQNILRANEINFTRFFFNNNFEPFKAISTPILNFNLPTSESISEGKFLYDPINDTIKFIGKSIYKEDGTLKDFLKFQFEDDVVKSELGWTNQNKNSKYFLLGRNLLIDRNNLKNSIDINDEIYFDKDEKEWGPKSIGCKTYNDSLLFISIRLDSKNNFNNLIQTNKRVEIDSKEILNYFRINNMNFESTSAIDSIIEKNLFGNSRNYILIFSFLKNKIIGILNDGLFPFEGIEKLFIDNSNSFLIADYYNGYITIFDIFKTQKVITFTGSAHSVDKNNYLITDPMIYYKYGEKGKNINGKYTDKDLVKYISVNKYNINELCNLKKPFIDNKEKYDINEFTTENELEKQIYKRFVSNAGIFILENSYIKNAKSKNYEIKDSTVSLKCLLSKFDYLYKNLCLKNTEETEHEMIRFFYKFYDQKRKCIVFESNKEISQLFLEHIEEKHQLIDGDKVFNDILSSDNHTIKYSINDNKVYVTLQPVEINEAKKLKDLNFIHGITCEHPPLSMHAMILENFRNEILKIIPDAILSSENSERSKININCDKHYSRLEAFKNEIQRHINLF